MKWLAAILGAFFILLQYQLWFVPGGIVSVWHLKKSVAQQQQKNQLLQTKNKVLAADIKDLKNGNQAIEEKARSELGMVKKGEVFYQVVNKKSNE